MFGNGSHVVSNLVITVGNPCVCPLRIRVRNRMLLLKFKSYRNSKLRDAERRLMSTTNINTSCHMFEVNPSTMKKAPWLNPKTKIQ